MGFLGQCFQKLQPEEESQTYRQSDRHSTALRKDGTQGMSNQLTDDVMISIARMKLHSADCENRVYIQFVVYMFLV